MCVTTSGGTVCVIKSSDAFFKAAERVRQGTREVSSTGNTGPCAAGLTFLFCMGKHPRDKHQPVPPLSTNSECAETFISYTNLSTSKDLRIGSSIIS